MPSLIEKIYLNPESYINRVDDGVTFLSQQVYNDDIDSVNILLDNGANPNKKSHGG